MKHKTLKPPLLARWLLSFLLNHSHPETMLADYDEIYYDLARRKGVPLAMLWYWFQIVAAIPSYINNSIYWSVTMFKNYVTIAFRTILKNKGYSFINIAGLAIGMACCLFITLWIIDELSYDQFHNDSDQIYQVLGNGIHSSTPLPLAAALKETFPDVIYSSRYEAFGEPLFRRGNKAFYESGIRVVDPDFFKIFSFPFLKGNPTTALENIQSIVISEEIAEKFFPGEDAIGKVLTINDERDFTVTGVMQTIPQNSTIRFDIAISYEIRILDAIANGGDTDSWGWWSPNTFLKLRKDVSVSEFNQKTADFFQKKTDEKDDSLSVLPISERRFFFWDIQKFITVFSVMAVFILLVACINFVNLSTARSANRANEIGIRKAAGALRKNLIIQFLGESFILTLSALIITLLIVATLLPLFNSFTGKQITTDSLNQPFILLIVLGLLLFTGIASGGYPALILSSLEPTQVLKGNFKGRSSSSLFRKILVVFQFSLSIILIIGTSIVYKQLEYIKTKDIGYAKEQLITISLKGESKKSYEVLKNRLKSDRRILGATGMADDLPNFWWTSSTAEWEGKDPTKEIHVGFNFVDYDIVKTLGIEMVEGRDFSKEFISDAETGYLVNEELVKLMNLESVVGRPFKEFGKAGKIVGIFKNVHFRPLTNQINPLYFQLNPEKINHIVIRIPTENLHATIQFIKKTWEEIIPMFPFEYRFVNEDFDRAYANIERMGRLANVFTFIAIFIACLGLFGLASFTSEQRTKEIGVRKVLGASMPGIVVLLSKEFTKWVLIANIIAWPVAWFVMNMWLQSFAYKTQIRLSVFLVSGALALIIALITVSYQSLKAAMMNPVDTLKYE